ncbi:hypothetical protein BJY04DRAFT_220589 [Aspergillus karnatakaensis]|uniref:uncharacterized protein n=1 Tax=Aspergillus karnatakaensis TaxID=1810916 RepID=UPI003CCD4533
MGSGASTSAGAGAGPVTRPATASNTSPSTTSPPTNKPSSTTLSPLKMITESQSKQTPKSQQPIQTTEPSTSTSTAVGFPLPTPNPNAIREPILTNACKKRLINNEIGYGLVSTKKIPAGSIVFADPLLILWAHEHQKCKTVYEANDLLEQRAKKLGKEWYAEFMDLLHVNRTGQDNSSSKNTTTTNSSTTTTATNAAIQPVLGVLGRTWDKHHLPITIDNKPGGVLGLNLAWVNHSCVPNCSLRFLTTTSASKSSKAHPAITHALLRTCTTIPAGVELSISYLPTRGSTTLRSLQMRQTFSFACHCRVCADPRDPYESHQREYHRYIDDLHNPVYIANFPAVSFHVASDLTRYLTGLRIQDVRLLNIWIRCAMIAGHHSDLGRAVAFLARARQIAHVLEGPSGEAFRRVERWCREPGLLPGSGATQRGTSTVGEGMKVLKLGVEGKTVLFMLGCKAEEYVRIRRYRLVEIEVEGDTDTTTNTNNNNNNNNDNTDGKEESTAGTGPSPSSKDENVKPKPKFTRRWEITLGEDPAPPALIFNTSKPHTMCCSVPGCLYEQEIQTKDRKQRVCGAKRAGRELVAAEKEVKCRDPEKGLLELAVDCLDEMDCEGGRDAGVGDGVACLDGSQGRIAAGAVRKGDGVMSIPAAAAGEGNGEQEIGEAGKKKKKNKNSKGKKKKDKQDDDVEEEKRQNVGLGLKGAVDL